MSCTTGMSTSPGSFRARKSRTVAATAGDRWPLSDASIQPRFDPIIPARSIGFAPSRSRISPMAASKPPAGTDKMPRSSSNSFEHSPSRPTM